MSNNLLKEKQRNKGTDQKKERGKKTKKVRGLQD